MRLFVLTRSHRNSSGTAQCAACRNWKKNTGKLAVGPDAESMAFPVAVLNVCSGCARDLLRMASGGRKSERP